MLQVKDVTVRYPAGKGEWKMAVDDVSFAVAPREVVARVRTVLRRAYRPSLAPPGEPDRLDVADLTIDLAGHEVWRCAERIELTALEFDILAMLASAPGRVS